MPHRSGEGGPTRLEAGVVLGAANVERALIERLRTLGVKITTDDIEWNSGLGLLLVTDLIPLKIKPTGASVAMRVVGRLELVASAIHVTAGMQYHIDQIASQYAHLK